MPVATNGAVHAVFDGTFESISDLPPGLLVTSLSVGAALIGLHAWRSRRNPVWLGALVPALYVVFAIVMSVSYETRPGTIAGYGITFLCLLAVWWAGEGSRQREREHEN